MAKDFLNKFPRAKIKFLVFVSVKRLENLEGRNSIYIFRNF